MSHWKTLRNPESLKKPLSLYRFMVNGKRLVYDVHACRVFGINKIAWDILEAMDKPNSDEMPEVLYGKYSRYTVDKFIDELNELRLLSAPDSERHKAPVHQPITFLRLHVSHSCNLRCKYCYASSASGSEEPVLMNERTAEKAIDFLIDQSGSGEFPTVQFFGGEPLLNFAVIKHIVAYATARGRLYNKNFKFYVFTNCYSLTGEIEKFLNENNFDIAISLDGPEAIHDSHRPTLNDIGSYEKVKLNALRLLETSNHDNLFIRGTFTSHNYDIKAMIIHPVQLGFRNISVQPCMLPEEHNYAIKLEDVPQVEEAYAQAAKAYLSSLMEGNFFYFYPLFDVMKKMHSPAPSLFPCDAGHGSLAVSPTGDIYPCHELLGFEEYKFGNVFDTGINKSVERLFHAAQVQNKKKCLDCWAKYLCGGGCHAHAIKYSGNILDPYEVECRFTQHRLRLGMWIYSVLAGEHPKALEALLNHDEHAYLASI